MFVIESVSDTVGTNRCIHIYIYVYIYMSFTVSWCIHMCDKCRMMHSYAGYKVCQTQWERIDVYTYIYIYIDIHIYIYTCLWQSHGTFICVTHIE